MRLWLSDSTRHPQLIQISPPNLGQFRQQPCTVLPSMECWLTDTTTRSVNAAIPCYCPPAAEFFNEIKVGSKIRVVANTRKGHHDVTSKNPELDGQEAIVMSVPVYPSTWLAVRTVNDGKLLKYGDFRLFGPRPSLTPCDIRQHDLLRVPRLSDGAEWRLQNSRWCVRFASFRCRTSQIRTIPGESGTASNVDLDYTALQTPSPRGGQVTV